MATSLWSFISDKKPLVGRIVYEAYYPQRLGRVIRHWQQPSNLTTQPLLDVVDVYWIKEKLVKVEAANYLQDFESLVLDTERKALRHRAAYEEAVKVEVVTDKKGE